MYIDRFTIFKILQNYKNYDWLAITVVFKKNTDDLTNISRYFC